MDTRLIDEDLSIYRVCFMITSFVLREKIVRMLERIGT